MQIGKQALPLPYIKLVPSMGHRCLNAMRKSGFHLKPMSGLKGTHCYCVLSLAALHASVFLPSTDLDGHRGLKWTCSSVGHPPFKQPEVT